MGKEHSQPILDGDPNIIKECRHGPMIYNRHDQYVGRSLHEYGEYNEEESDALCGLLDEGDVVLEIGANMGSHTVALAKAVGRTGKVYAFEPQMPLFHLLAGNVALNGLFNVFTYNLAIGAREGTIKVPPLDYKNTGNFGALSLEENQNGTQVLLKPLDVLAGNLSKCKLIKVDVEGMELEVLQGGQKLIERHQPVLYVENDRKEKSKALLEFVMSIGYQPYWHLPRLFNPKNFFENEHDIFGDVPNLVSANVLCAPSWLVVDVMDDHKIQDTDSWYTR